MRNKTVPGFRDVPKTGVIYVMNEARKLGFSYDDPQWANLGQGSPETGPIPGAPPRITELTIDPSSHRYSAIEGEIKLRQKVADFYNEIYRKDKKSKYTYENVSISGGGRVAITRLAAALGNINVGHFLPDYTAYEELLSVFRAFIPIPILLNHDVGYHISVADLRKEILGRGLRAILVSNPCNPTGQVIAGNKLKKWVALARETRCTLILDQFYSHYIYNTETDSECAMVSAAEYIEDVDEDPVILVDGLTKNWRYPGWRISWTLAPKPVIDIIASAGSFLDGGANNPFQQQAISLLEPEFALQEAKAIQNYFGKKRRFVLKRLTELDISVESRPGGTFYFWANLSDLPAPLNDGLHFFQEGLKEKVITVPGIFFDVNPDRRRSLRRYQNYCRISFGPEMERLEVGLASIERLIKKFS
ncbi:pyridoxal phosphate-dependent aminotransferase [Anaerolineales bacterium HSG6]|nr:pyridoxal phosphate-dependent aminotransferase [Anaerolineales bacterium HSG6]